MDEHPESAGDSLEGVVLQGRYTVERLLGEGGMGRVYIATHDAIGKRVAIKVLNEEMSEHPHVVERFKREARAATAVGSEHIIDVTDMGELENGAPYIVMELLDGIELGELLETEGPMRIGRAVRILQQACDALEAAHEAGIVHRDLKPENIFLVKRRSGTDFVKLLDFGISKFTERANGVNQKLTQTGMTMGTPSYMSPEQAQGAANMDHRTDIYALGVILYEMLTGDVPFGAESFALLLVKILTEPPPTVREKRPDVPPGLEALITRCLAKEANERFIDCAALRAALDPYADIDGEPLVLTTMAERPTARPGPRAGEEEPTRAAKGSGDIVAETGPLESLPPGLLPDAGPEETSAADASSDQPPRSSRGPLIAAGVALAVFGAAAVGWALTREEQTLTRADAGPPAPVDAGAAAAVPAEVRLRVVAAPQDATITLDGVEYPNPLDTPRPRSLDPVRLVIAREGYETHEELLVLDRDRELVRTLSPASETEEEDEAREASPTTMSRRRRRSPPAEQTMAGMAAEPSAMSGAGMTEMSAGTMESTMEEGFRDEF